MEEVGGSSLSASTNHMKTLLPSEFGRLFEFTELAMKNFLVVSAFLILLLFGENILEAVGGSCLLVVGIVAFIAWLIWRFG